VGTNFSEVAQRLVEETDLDTVLIAGRHTLLNRGAEQELLPACLERGVDVLTAGVFNSGLLADPDAADAHYDYGQAPPEVLAAAQRLARICRNTGRTSEPRTAVPAQTPGVTAVVLGAASAAEVRDSTRSFRLC
jgi:D-threo-aldose 1-dehydrogenase